MARSPFTLPVTSEASPRRIALPSGHILVLSVVLILVGLVGGNALSARWQQQSDLLQQPITRQGGREFVEATILKLEAEQAELKRDLADAQAQLDQLQSNSALEKAQLSDIAAAIAAEKVSAGQVALEGPGIIAVFRDSSAPAIPANEDPRNYILHDYDLRDVLNTLWAANAEAISLNGERILSNTSLYCVGTTVICNITRLSPPYEIHAIGNPDALEAGLHTSPQMAPFLARAQIYDLPIDIRKVPKVPVPAYSGAVTFNFARPGDGSDSPPTTPAGH